MAMGLAAVDAVHAVAGVRGRLKWPNDVVWPGDGSADDRKLAGILAEAHWPPAGDVAVVIGIGINVNWPDDLPDDLRHIAVALNHLAGATVDRDALLVALLTSFGRWYEELGRPSLLAAWRAASATLGRRVRVDLGHEVVEGVARDITDEGYLVVDDRTFSVGDVVHLRVADSDTGTDTD
jgi:BirA family biotin operon repressor/biotin-[acetyl-CoA-carboxylase] ligase